jgi:enamine deaminase RidA (YjgF/YER057c/UK114 family)
MARALHDRLPKMFGKERPPPRTVVQVAALNHDDMLLKIDVIAAV